jgi:hypothetical protein
MKLRTILEPRDIGTETAKFYIDYNLDIENSDYAKNNTIRLYSGKTLLGIAPMPETITGSVSHTWTNQSGFFTELLSGMVEGVSAVRKFGRNALQLINYLMGEKADVSGFRDLLSPTIEKSFFEVVSTYGGTDFNISINPKFIYVNDPYNPIYEKALNNLLNITTGEYKEVEFLGILTFIQFIPPHGYSIEGGSLSSIRGTLTLQFGEFLQISGLLISSINFTAPTKRIKLDNDTIGKFQYVEADISLQFAYPINSSTIREIFSFSLNKSNPENSVSRKGINVQT